jgi:hypothetical protein
MSRLRLEVGSVTLVGRDGLVHIVTFTGAGAPKRADAYVARLSEESPPYVTSDCEEFDDENHVVYRLDVKASRDIRRATCLACIVYCYRLGAS